MNKVRASLEVGFPGGVLPEAFAALRGQQTRAIGVLSEFPYENAQFDVVLMDGGAVSPKAVREAHRVLKPEGRLYFIVPERTKGQDGYTLPEIYSIVREGFNISEVSRPPWWLFGLRGRTISICATKKAWKAVVNTYRPYVGLAAGLVLLSCPLFAMTSADAVAVVLNSRNATDKRTFEAATELLERDAKDGKALQQFVVGIMTKDRDLSKRYLDASRGKIRTLAEKKNNALAWYLLSMESNDIELLKKAVAGENVQALNAFGTISIQEAKSRAGTSSNDLQRIMREGYDCFRKAAMRQPPDPNGCVNLGMCHLNGFGCEQDAKKGFELLLSAAEAGHLDGMDSVADCYRHGRGVARNDELALLWEMRARAARGDEAAAQWLKDRK